MLDRFLTINQLLDNKEGIEALDSKDFTKAYDLLHKYERADLTKLLLNENINPLDYMETIPSHFMDRKDLEVYIPSKVKKIGQEAFIGCRELNKITFNEGLEKIEMLSFADCIKLKELNFPTTLKYIGDSSFIGCKQLEVIHFKKGLQYISSRAFKDCESLKLITFCGMLEEWRDIGLRTDAFDNAGTTQVKCLDGTIDLFN